MKSNKACLIRPTCWKESCRSSITNLYERVRALSEVQGDISDSELTQLKSILCKTTADDKELVSAPDATAYDFCRALNLLGQYCSISEGLLSPGQSGWENISLYAATLCSLLLNVECILELIRKDADDTIPSYRLIDFSDSFRSSELAKRVMRKLESSSLGIDYVQLLRPDAAMEFGLGNDVLSRVWSWLGIALNGNDCFQSATRLFACAYNVGASGNVGNTALADSAEAICANLVVVREYEMAAALCCRLLYGVPRGHANPLIKICDGFSPVLFGGLNGRFNIEMVLANALTGLANRFERVARARRKPFAALEPSCSAESEYLDYYLEYYAQLADMLRSIALCVMRPHLSSDDHIKGRIASYGYSRVLLARHELNDYMGLSEKTVRNSWLCEAREVVKELGNDNMREVVLKLRVLLAFLGTFGWDGTWYGCGTPEELEDALGDFHDNIKDYNSLISKHSANPESVIWDFEQDFADDLFIMCANLLSKAEGETNDEIRSASRDAVMCLVGIATSAVRLRKSRECVFTEERDYASGIGGPCGQVYKLLSEYAGYDTWEGLNTEGGAFSKQLIQYYLSCLHGDESARESSSDDGSGIAYYTTLGTANFLFDLLYLPDGEKHAVSASELGEDAKGGSGKNCLTVMHASYMNDPNEGTSLLEHLGCLSLWPFRDSKESARERIARGGFTFLKSFTTMVDQLHMWSMYGSDGSAEGDCDGCCVRFSRDMFTKAEGFARGSDDEGWNLFTLGNRGLSQSNALFDGNNLYRVVYLDGEGEVIGERKAANAIAADCLKRMKYAFELVGGSLNRVSSISKLLSSVVDEGDLREVLIGILTPIAFLVKDESYSREEEMRLLFRRPLEMGEDGDICTIPATPTYRSKLCIKPFRQVGIDEIILGPKLSKPYEVVPYLTIKLAKMKKDAAGHGIRMEGRVTQSKIDYR